MTDRAFPIISVVDLGATRAFYEGLGFVQTYQFPPEGEPGFVTMARGGSSIGIGAGGVEPGEDRFGYWVYVDDVDEVVRELGATGAPVIAEPADQPWGERVAQVRDPAGTLVYLGAPSGEDGGAGSDLDGLVELMSDAASAFIGGDMSRYFDLMRHADDFTLMPPTGGDTIHGPEVTDEEMEESARFFKRGECTLEVQQTYSSGDLAVLVVIERQRGEVGDFPEQDLSLRVTLVFRRAGAHWRLVHRHADALVHPITIDHVLELARGT
jgi:ketosteroid isomerase-like protein/predicted enzyme related to lactoylglutathione lyase